MILDKELELLNNEEASEPLQDKKKAYILLYNKIELYYNNFGVNAFDILNDLNTRDEIIQDILKDSTDEELIIYLKTQYTKINKQLKQEYKYFNINEEAQTTNNIQDIKIKFNWGYLFKTILYILLFPIFIISSCAITSGNRKGNKRK